MGVCQVIPSKLFLSHSAEKNCGVTLQRFRKFPVCETIYGGEIRLLIFFRRKFFVSQCPKAPWGNHSMFQKNWGFEKIYAQEVQFTVFRRIFLVSQCRKKICLPKKYWYRKNSDIGRGRHCFAENFLFHMTETLRKLSLLCFRIFQVWKNFMDERLGGGGGASHFSVENFLAHSAEKLRRDTNAAENF